MELNERSVNIEQGVSRQGLDVSKLETNIIETEYPDWMTEDDIENYNNSKLLTLCLVSNDTKEKLNEYRQMIFKEKESLKINIQIFSKDIDYTSRNNNTILQKKLGMRIKTGNKVKDHNDIVIDEEKSIILSLSILTTTNDPEKIRRLLFQKFVELDQKNKRLDPKKMTKSIIILSFDISEDDLIKYMCGKTVVLSATQLEV
jgi:hypothetical protein